MDEPISGDNQAAAGADNLNGHAPEPDGTSQGGGQPDGQTGHADDLFKGIDPAKLPPELRPHLDSMVRTYREKTEKLSETVKSETAKAVEAFKSKAELYDQLAGQEEFVKLWNEHVQAQQARQAHPSDPATAQLEKKLQEMEVKIHQREASEVIDAFSSAVDEKGEKLHPDFDKFNQLVVGAHEQSGEYSLLRAAIELAPGKSSQEKLENGYKQVKALYDSIFDEGKKAGMGRVQAKARNGSLAPSSVNAGATAPRAPKDAMEALQFARQGLLPSTK